MFTFFTVKEKAPDQESSSESEEINDDTPCQRCGKYDHPDWVSYRIFDQITISAI